MKTCLNRLVGICKDCERDYENEVNNLSCWRYVEVNLSMMEVKNYPTTEVANA